MSNWFTVDKAGLAAVLERRGKFFAIAELLSNAWDSGADRVEIILEPILGEPYCELDITDNGEGFADLSHAHTMFAKSSRATVPTKRGRFNLGEKLVLAICRTASIDTRCGGLRFLQNGIRRTSSTYDGTRFHADIRMTRDELDEMCDLVRRVIPPVTTTFNGTEIPRHDSIVRFDAKLPSEVADSDGLIRRTVRTGTVEVYESATGGELLEMGIPVVELDMPYRVNVLQKIPLNMDRDNVTPGFVKALSVAVLNHVYDRLTSDDAVQPWAQEAASDARATKNAVQSVIRSQFGDHAVAATPNDPIANAQAQASGFAVVPGGALSGGLWANVRKHELLPPSGQVFPTPTPDQIKIQRDNAGTCPTCGRSF